MVKKTETERRSIKEFFTDKDYITEYIPFVRFIVTKEPLKEFVIIEFLEDEPEKYINKWGREQWKILVNEYSEYSEKKEEKMLSGGKRLYNALMEICVERNVLPTELGLVWVWRMGSGFQTHYRFIKFQKQQKLDDILKKLEI